LGRKEEFAQLAKDEAGIPVIVKDPSEMMGKIDALIVDHRYGRSSLRCGTTVSYRPGYPPLSISHFAIAARRQKYS